MFDLRFVTVSLEGNHGPTICILTDSDFFGGNNISNSTEIDYPKQSILTVPV